MNTDRKIRSAHTILDFADRWRENKVAKGPTGPTKQVATPTATTVPNLKYVRHMRRVLARIMDSLELPRAELLRNPPSGESGESGESVDKPD